jgi:hypothetical protein
MQDGRPRDCSGGRRLPRPVPTCPDGFYRDAFYRDGIGDRRLLIEEWVPAAAGHSERSEESRSERAG